MKNLNRPSLFISRQTAETRRRYCLLLAILFVLFIILTACRDKIGAGSAEVKRPSVSGVVITKIEMTQVDDYYETSGTVRAKVTNIISSRVMGMVTAVNVKAGDEVRAGQSLMTLDDRDAAQRVKAAEHGLEAAGQNMELADITYRRYKKLHDEKALSRQEIDQIETQKKVATSEYQRMKASLEDAKIYRGFSIMTSPIAGRVTEKKIEAGNIAMPGMPLLTLEGGSGFNIEAYVDESLSGKLKNGMPVRVVIDPIDLATMGTITEIVPAVDSLSRTFRIKIAVADPKLKSGLYSKVLIPRGKKEVILAPKVSVIEKGQLTGVYTVDNLGVIAYRLVRTGKTFGDNVEILSGLTAGDRIITGGVEKAVDGGLISEGNSR